MYSSFLVFSSSVYNLLLIQSYVVFIPDIGGFLYPEVTFDSLTCLKFLFIMPLFYSTFLNIRHEFTTAFLTSCLLILPFHFCRCFYQSVYLLALGYFFFFSCIYDSSLLGFRYFPLMHVQWILSQSFKKPL